MQMPSDLKNYLNILNRRGELDSYYVVNGFKEVLDRYYSLVGQVDNSTWHELGQVSITNNMLPEVGTWLDALNSNLDVLSAACTGYNSFRESLISLEGMIIRYNFLAETDPMTEDVEYEMSQLKIKIDEMINSCNKQKSYLEGLSNEIGSISVEIKVPSSNNVEETYELKLSDFVKEISSSISKISGLSDIEGYRQDDKRWADLTYGPGTYKDSACGPTALATVLSYCLGVNILPTEVGYYEGNKLLTNQFGTKWYAAKIIGWNYFVGSDVFKDVTEDNVRTELLEGHPIVYGINYKDGGHYIALTDIDANNMVTVQDPIKGTYKERLVDLIANHREGVPFISFNPRDDTAENYNDIVLLTQTNE